MTYHYINVMTFSCVCFRKYSPYYFFEEMRGLSDGAGIDYNFVVRVHMLPELVKVKYEVWY